MMRKNIQSSAAHRSMVASVLLPLISLLLPVVAFAQTGGPYDLTWSTIDSGGATFATGGSYTLGGTAGQPDAGVSSGGPYVLKGGFWAGGAGIAVPVEDEVPETRVQIFRLYAAAPNPFNPRTAIAFDLPQAGSVRLNVFDLRGSRVRTLESSILPAGHHVRTWDGRNDGGAPAASGTYFFTIEAGDFRARQKAVLVK